MTTPGDLDCKYLIHTVGPVYSKYFPPKTKLEGNKNLAKCITNILDRAHALGDVTSISIPAISSIIHGFPAKKCSEIILNACVEWCHKNGGNTKISDIRMCNRDEETSSMF